MKRLTRKDARRLATQITRLPELLKELKLLSAARDVPVTWSEGLKRVDSCRSRMKSLERGAGPTLG